MNIALEKSYLCPECSFIGDNAKHCEKCLTTNILPLADVLNRTDLNAAGAYHPSSVSQEPLQYDVCGQPIEPCYLCGKYECHCIPF